MTADEAAARKDVVGEVRLKLLAAAGGPVDVAFDLGHGCPTGAPPRRRMLLIVCRRIVINGAMFALRVTTSIDPTSPAAVRNKLAQGA